jgi:hypothetical protein
VTLSSTSIPKEVHDTRSGAEKSTDITCVCMYELYNDQGKGRFYPIIANND